MAEGSDTAGETVRNTETYRVTYYPRSAIRLTIVFISAGRSAPGEPVEEFRRTLERFDTSIVFVLDRNALWFNYDETDAMFAELRSIAAGYAQVATVGESMGGCGALLARREIQGVGRTLASAPQFSIAKPFVNFDVRYEPTACRIARFRDAHYAAVPDPAGCTLLYGTLDWRDYLHGAMYAGHGFAPQFVAGAGHNVSAFLKEQPGNGLVRLMGAFLDWDHPFDAAALAALFPGLMVPPGLQPGYGPAFVTNGGLLAALDAAYTAATGDVLGPELARLRPATQSSTSPWSRAPTREADAAGAVRGGLSGSYSFHTAAEENPWWSVDLGDEFALDEVRVFNLVGEPALMARCAQLRLELSQDGASWHTALERREAAPFGGIDGHPLVWRPTAVALARHLRITALGHTHLHLDGVQVYGRRYVRAG